MHNAKSRIALAVGMLLGCAQTFGQMQYRSLSGTVMDQHHEPLRGAVVQVENLGNQYVQSFITDKAGHYDFKRLDSGADYSFWAQYRGHKSRSRTLSKFNSRMAPVVPLTIKLE